MYSIRTNSYYLTRDNLSLSKKIKDKFELNSEDQIISKEKTIFWEQPKKQEFQLFEDKFTKVKSINNCCLNSVENFISFSKNIEFKEIKFNFINDIYKFEKLVIFFLKEENSTFYQNKTDVLLEKIGNTENYAYHNEAIITLFDKTREQLHTIVQILEQIKQYQQDFYLHNNVQSLSFININYLEQIIANSVTDIDMCFDGVIARIDNFYHEITACIAGRSGLIASSKKKLITIFTAEFEENLIALGLKKRHKAMSVHYNTYLANVLSASFSLEKIVDHRANFNLNFKILNELKNKAELALSPMNIVNYLTNNMYQEFLDWLEKYNLSNWVENCLLAEDLPVSFTDDLQQNFIGKYNVMYNCCNTENKLCFYTFISDISTGIIPFFSIKDAYIKLHAWIANALSSPCNKRIIHILENNSALAIVAIGTCHFWIANSNVYNSSPNKIDFEDYQKLELKHISIELFDNILLETTRAIILQALRQTDVAEDIISFFAHPIIYDLLLLDEHLLENINQLISFKITTNTALRQQLVTIIYNEYLHNKSQMHCNIKNSYWFCNSNLLELVLLKCSKNGLDISPFLNQLTVKQILQLNTKFSLKKLCKTALTTTPDFLESKHFVKLYYKLNKFNDSYAIIKIIHSGTIDHILYDSISVEFNKKMLFNFIKNNDVDGICLLKKLNCKHNNLEMLDINVVDEYGNTALMIAAANGYKNCIQSLLQINLSLPKNKHIKINKTMRVDKCTALLLAAKKGYIDCVKLLITRKNINTPNNFGISPLMFAAKEGHQDIVDLLLKYGEDIAVNAQDYKGRSALIAAVFSENINCVKSLLEFNKTAVNLQDNDGISALMYATFVGNEKIVNILLENENINVNLQDKQGATALMIAICRGYVGCVELIIKCPNIDINIQNISGHSALMDASVMNNNIIIDMLLKVYNINVNLKGKNGFSALLIAASQNYKLCLKSLVEHKDININITNDQGWSALMLTCYHGYTECLELIIQHKNVDFNLVNYDNKTALIIASLRNQKACKSLLKKYTYSDSGITKILKYIRSKKTNN